MQVTMTGILLMALGLIVLLFKPKSLYSFLVFFIPFSATAVINVVKGSSGSGLQATMFFGALFMLVLMIQVTYSRTFVLLRPSRNSLNYLFLYLLVALISLIMPFILEGKVLIESAGLMKKEFYELQFSFTNITQFLYLTYGVLLVVLVIHRNSSEKWLKQTLKIYIISGLVISLWGLMQYLFSKVGVRYPDQIFNNSINDSARGFYGVINDMKRISSVATEPSIFAKHLLTLIPLLLFSIIGKRPIWSPIMDKVTLGMLLTVLLLSTSSTGYVGLVFTAIVSVLMIILTNEFRISHYINFTAVLVIVGVLFASSYYLQDMMDQLILNKASSYSGQERTQTVTLAWGYFLRSPILGLGWGSVTSQDLIVNILANTGFVGLAVFLLLLINVIGKIVRNIQTISLDKKLASWKPLATGILVSLLTEIFTSMITGFPFTYSNFWFVMALAISISALIEKEQKALVQEKGGVHDENSHGNRVLSSGSMWGRRLHL